MTAMKTAEAWARRMKKGTDRRRRRNKRTEAKAGRVRLGGDRGRRGGGSGGNGGSRRNEEPKEAHGIHEGWADRQGEVR
ncbi:hypothetical protein ALC56_05992 [Trachymyrmex septentrionalis]|uniref:Uncharacterized protein n=1 Tax=Trachymyrmex septentrionalis TaxID=34720 RepID=A0A195FHL7_9HYME|nr:hypothetical protein ALC56_05992 [Trachymyrmex septentrionalis]